MSFGRIKTLYCIAVVSLAALLFVSDSLVRGSAAVVLLIGALPMFRLITRENTLNVLRAVGLRHEVERHIQSTDQSSEDRSQVQQ